MNLFATVRIRPLLVWMLSLILIIQGCQPEEDPGPQVVVETGQIEEVGPTHSVVHGAIHEIGLDGIQQHGFVWSELPDPSLETGEVIQLGTTYGATTFSSTIRNLAPNTTYYVKAFAANGSQTGYGGEKEFETSSPTVPAVYTSQAYEIGPYSAVAGGAILTDGGSEITARGICWATRPPSINDDCTTDGTGMGSFESELTQLEPYTVYFIRAYATNSLGTAYGETFGLITLWDDSPVGDIDGNQYATFQLGDQVWMAENLKAIHYADGTPIDQVETADEWLSLDLDSKAYASYDNSDSDFGTYGALYTWSAAMNGEASSDEYPGEVQGVCPDGWHLPSESEWKQLEYDLGMSELDVRDKGWRGWEEGGLLKQAGTSLWVEPNYLGTNESGFTAIPGGFREKEGEFKDKGSFAAFWSSTGFEDAALMRGLHSKRGNVLRENYPKKSGLSVRCVKEP
jgi:uncharacterized protein (TIGR02145 family)